MKKIVLFVIMLGMSVCAFTQTDKTQAVPFKVMVNGQEQGPYNLEQLKPMIQSGQITRNTMVWQQGMSGWSEAEQVPELNELLKAVPSAQVQIAADTMKVKQEKKVKVKNAYYYKKRGNANAAIGLSFILVGGVCALTVSGDLAKYGYMVAGGIAGIGVIELIIGLSQKGHAKKLAVKEKAITITPARSGIGIAINF